MMAFVTVPKFLCHGICMPMNYDFGNFRHVKGTIFAWVHLRDDKHSLSHEITACGFAHECGRSFCYQ